MFPCRGGWVGKWVVGVENDISGRESHYAEEISNPPKICLRKDFNFSHVWLDQVKIKISTDIITTKVYKPHWIVLVL